MEEPASAEEESSKGSESPTEEGTEAGDEDKPHASSNSLICSVQIEYSRTFFRKRVRSFPLQLPEELNELGMSEKRWRKIIKKVNRIWDPYGEKCMYCIGVGCPLDSCDDCEEPECEGEVRSFLKISFLTSFNSKV